MPKHSERERRPSSKPLEKNDLDPVCHPIDKIKKKINSKWIAGFNKTSHFELPEGNIGLGPSVVRTPQQELINGTVRGTKGNSSAASAETACRTDGRRSLPSDEWESRVYKNFKELNTKNINKWTGELNTQVPKKGRDRANRYIDKGSASLVMRVITNPSCV